ncbi:MAG TPA: helix-turn-helix transcriptional regulator [Polyangiaceae bacterium]|nr:helix-turn-helix transcriptional regulator [Polyangiaceae bacterium]
MPLTSSQHSKIAFQLFEALGSSLSMNVVLERAYPLLTRLVPADYGALGVSSSGRPEDYAWTVAQIPAAFFAAYPEMAAHDFVRHAVARRPNLVLRDQDMVERAELEKNPLYRRAREVGVPLEQVMAVMLHVDDRWQSGLSLYRERRRPFSIHERSTLQRVAPALSNAVRHCHLFAAAKDWSAALEHAFAAQGGAILTSPNGNELARSSEAARLIEKWFSASEQRGAALPEPLAKALELQKNSRATSPWRRHGGSTTLEVSFLPWAGSCGSSQWMLLLKERTDMLALPAAWCRLLTHRQRQVTAGVLQGWDNRLIASELGCSVGTVKKHLQNIFERLGVERRVTLLRKACAAQAAHNEDS